jgi:hypothetical protein
MQPFAAFRKWRRQEAPETNISNYSPYRHLEHHFNAAEVVKDIILGLSGKWTDLLENIRQGKRGL